MNTKQMTINANAFNFQAFQEIGKIAIGKGNEMYKLHLIQGEICSRDLEFYKTEAGKKFFESVGEKHPKVEDFIKSLYKTSKQHFYRLKKAFELPSDVRKAYEESETETRTIEKLLKFANSEDEPSEDKAIKKDDSLKISVKDGKITIKGNAKISEIDLLISELQRMKQGINSPKAA